MKTVYIKLTNKCQLKCLHCYNTIVPDTISMDDTTSTKVKLFLVSLRFKDPTTPIEIIFHGGEPTLGGLDIINDIISDLDPLGFTWMITTNLCYNLTPAHIKLFSRMSDKIISTSWDYKIRFSSLEQRKLWENNVATLKAAGLGVHVIICLTKLLIEDPEATPARIMNVMAYHGISSYNFERITDTGRAVENKLKPNNLSLNTWLLEAYKIYKKTPGIIIPLFYSIDKSIQGTLLGCRARKCSQNVLTISPTGELAGCPNIADKTFGNIEAENYKEKNKLIAIEKHQSLKCLTCAYFKFCNGDCYQLTADESGCQGLPSIYSYILNNNQGK